MVSSREEWIRAFREYIEGALRTFENPPTDDELLAYADGGLSEVDRERVRRWLVLNPAMAHVLFGKMTEEPSPNDPAHLTEVQMIEGLEWLLRDIESGKGEDR